jgi:hypothetical protein
MLFVCGALALISIVILLIFIIRYWVSTNWVSFVVVLILAIATIALLIYLEHQREKKSHIVGAPEYKEKQKRLQEERKARQRRERIGEIFDRYVRGTTCIGLSPYCRITKSKGAIVCRNCRIAQGSPNPIGFAQSGGMLTRQELSRLVLEKLLKI